MATLHPNHLNLLFTSVLILSAGCSKGSSDKTSSQFGVTEAGVVEEFKYPEQYAAVVEAAEAGDEQSIKILSQYYLSLPKTDLRNLEYWSRKASKIWGRGEFTNLIVALAAHQKCDRAWKILIENYPRPKEFPFYHSDGEVETIDNQCKRELR